MNEFLLSSGARVLLKLRSKSYNRFELSKALMLSSNIINKTILSLLSEKLVIEEAGFICPYCQKIIEEISAKKRGRTVSITDKGRKIIEEFKEAPS